jgi:hypothetical protein
MSVAATALEKVKAFLTPHDALVKERAAVAAKIAAAAADRAARGAGTRPRWARLYCTIAGSALGARRRSRPPQRGHCQAVQSEGARHAHGPRLLARPGPPLPAGPGAPRRQPPSADGHDHARAAHGQHLPRRHDDHRPRPPRPVRAAPRGADGGGDDRARAGRPRAPASGDRVALRAGRGLRAPFRRISPAWSLPVF